MKYEEIFRLKHLLEENHIPFEWVEYDIRNRYQICYPEKSENIVCSVIELHGLLSTEENCASILENLTAVDVFNRIRKHYKKTLLTKKNPVVKTAGFQHLRINCKSHGCYSVFFAELR